MVDFINLTNGLGCCEVRDPHYLRIQSTWCEQKRWEDVLLAAGNDLLYHLATGATIRVHDVSERPRVTRALWQGLPWIRYACERTWGLAVSPPVMRNGMNAESYFSTVYRGLDARTVRQVDYFSKFLHGTIDLSICTQPRLEAVA